MRDVLHLLQCTNLGGMEKADCLIMEALMEAGGRFHVATPRPFGELAPRLKAIDPDAVDNGYRGRFGLWSQSAFEQKVRDRYQPGQALWVTGTDVACLRAIQSLEGPKLLSHHYHHFENRASWLRWKLFYELLCHQLAAVTYPSDFTRQEALRLAPWLRPKAHVVRVAFDIAYQEATLLERRAEAKKALGLSPDTFVIGNAGWLVARKRWDVFLEVMASVTTRLPDCHGYILGGGPLEIDLKALAQQRQLSDKVSFEGWQSDIERYFSAMDVLLFASDFDTLPRTPGEAMAKGCVVVGSLKYGGLDELVRHETTGVLLREHHVDKLANAIVALAQQPERARQYREAAADLLQREFSRESAVGFYRDFFSA